MTERQRCGVPLSGARRGETARQYNKSVSVASRLSHRLSRWNIHLMGTGEGGRRTTNASLLPSRNSSGRRAGHLGDDEDLISPPLDLGGDFNASPRCEAAASGGMATSVGVCRSALRLVHMMERPLLPRGAGHGWNLHHSACMTYSRRQRYAPPAAAWLHDVKLPLAGQAGGAPLAFPCLVLRWHGKPYKVRAAGCGEENLWEAAPIRATGRWEGEGVAGVGEGREGGSEQGAGSGQGQEGHGQGGGRGGQGCSCAGSVYSLLLLCLWPTFSKQQ